MGRRIRCSCTHCCDSRNFWKTLWHLLACAPYRYRGGTLDPGASKGRRDPRFFITDFLVPIETLATTHFSSEEAMVEAKKAMVEAAHDVTIDYVKIERQRDRETHLTSTLDLK